jgi:nitrite reductase/ring-hydroxylating ferredoxin subunit
MYMLGVRNHADASELEEYWLDNKASMRQRGEPAPFPEEHLGEAIQTYFSEAVTDPEAWQFNTVRPIFSELGFKIDRSLTEGAPRVRGLYNKERAEIIRRTRAMQATRALQRGRLYPSGVEFDAWRRAIRDGQLGPGEMTELRIEGVRILLANIDGLYYAIDGACTHDRLLSAIRGLAEGDLDTTTGCVTCPWHGAQYDVRTGKAERQPYAAEFNREHRLASGIPAVIDPRRTAKDVRPYKTKVDNGYVWVNVI